MGVSASYCELCGLPVQFDHYVDRTLRPGSRPGGAVYDIYRRGNTGSSGFSFGPQHEWLADAVAVAMNDGATPDVLEGPVEDGNIGEGENSRSLDGYAPLHRCCWQRIGSPRRWKTQGRLPPFAEIEPFQGQLFDFPGVESAGLSRLLVDPRGSDDSARAQSDRLKVLAEIYTGARPSPVKSPANILDYLNFAMSAHADVLELVPGDRPRIFRGEVPVPHDFDAVTEEGWQGASTAGMDNQAMRELFDTGEVKTQFSIKGLCRVELSVCYRIDPLVRLARFSLQPPLLP